MLAKETISRFSYVKQVHRNLEGLSPSNRAQNGPPVGKVLGLERFVTLLQVLRLPERTGNSTVKDQNCLLVSLYIYKYIYSKEFGD